MSQTDPIAEILTRIRNASRARHHRVEVNHSRLREAICRTLLNEGFLSGVETVGDGARKKLVLELRYSPAGEPIIRQIQRVSRPSLRRYAGCDEIGKVKGAMGLEIVSTALGVMTGREARRKKVGGEILLAVW